MTVQLPPILIRADHLPTYDERKAVVASALESGYTHIILRPEDEALSHLGRYTAILADGKNLMYSGERIGVLLNLTGADMVVHFDPWWNPAVEDQATDRAHRIGQKRTVYSIKMIAEHTVEEKVLEMQRRKQAIINATVGVTDEAVMKKLSFDDIRDLIGLS